MDQLSMERLQDTINGLRDTYCVHWAPDLLVTPQFWQAKTDVERERYRFSTKNPPRLATNCTLSILTNPNMVSSWRMPDRITVFLTFRFFSVGFRAPPKKVIVPKDDDSEERVYICMIFMVLLKHIAANTKCSMTFVVPNGRRGGNVENGVWSGYFGYLVNKVSLVWK